VIGARPVRRCSLSLAKRRWALNAASKARAHLDRLADLYATSAHEAELVAIFREATRRDRFWEMGWRAAQRVE
jgi:hypothetical protein